MIHELGLNLNSARLKSTQYVNDLMKLDLVVIFGMLMQINFVKKNQFYFTVKLQHNKNST